MADDLPVCRQPNVPSHRNPQQTARKTSITDTLLAAAGGRHEAEDRSMLLVEHNRHIAVQSDPWVVHQTAFALFKTGEVLDAVHVQ
jgi:hypothetical protein